GRMGGVLRLGAFTAIMFAALLSFLEERDLGWLEGLWRKSAMDIQPRPEGFGRAWKPILLGAGLHAIAAGLFAAGGYAVQSSFDWYGVFGRRSPAPLKARSEGEVGGMLAQRSPAYEDYFHRIDLGTRVGGNQVFGAPDRFRIGQRAYVLTQIPLPHPA